MFFPEQAILSTIGVNKIKYNVLDELDLDNIDALHIDLNSILTPLFKMNDMFKESLYTATVSSSIINIAAHFRQYFCRHGWDVSIYFYYDKYMNDHKGQRSVNAAIEHACEIARIVCNYIPKIYVINKPSVRVIYAMKYFTDKHKNNYIMTKNTLMYQLISKHVSVLKVARDDSYIVNKSNLYNCLLGEKDTDIVLSNNLLGSVLAISGCHGFKGIKGLGLKKTIRLLDKYARKGRIRNDRYGDFRDLLEDTDLIDKCESVSKLESEYESIDVSIITIKSSGGLSNRVSIELNKYIVDKFSKKDLRNLNVKYYTDFNSLMLEELMMEPRKNAKSNKKKKEIKW